MSIWSYTSIVLSGTYTVLLFRAAGQVQRQGVGQAGHSVLGITANSAIGLLGLLLFINILRVGDSATEYNHYFLLFRM